MVKNKQNPIQEIPTSVNARSGWALQRAESACQRINITKSAVTLAVVGRIVKTFLLVIRLIKNRPIITVVIYAPTIDIPEPMYVIVTAVVSIAIYVIEIRYIVGDKR